MEGKTLEDVIQHLNRLEKMVKEVNEKLSRIAEELTPDASKNCETPDGKQDDNIGAKAIERVLERMGYPPDFKPRPLKEVRESIVESGIRPEDNEFSRAIIAEREK